MVNGLRMSTAVLVFLSLTLGALPAPAQSPSTPSDTAEETVTPVLSEQDAARDMERPKQSREEAIKSYCEHLARGLEHANELSSACQFVFLAQYRMPNYICDQRTQRFEGQPGQNGTLRHSKQKDLVTAKVTVVGGRQEFSDMRINGKPDRSPSASGAWEDGSYGPILLAAFSPALKPGIKFSGEKELDSGRALLFDFRVEQQNNHQFRLTDGPSYWDSASHSMISSKSLYPGITGRLWVEPATGRILQIDVEHTDLRDFALSSMRETIFYGDVKLGDGSSFVLPTVAEMYSCRRDSSVCARNVTSFANCHKFAAKSRIVAGTEEVAPK